MRVGRGGYSRGHAAPPDLDVRDLAGLALQAGAPVRLVVEFDNGLTATITVTVTPTKLQEENPPNAL